MNVGTTISRPEVTMPEAETEAIRAAYRAADVILEYGSGGSTVMAAEMAGKRVYSVESDRDWAQMMRGWFAENAPAEGSQVDVIWADVGATRKWGYPVDTAQYLNFAAYPLGVWTLEEFTQPDVVLVDGRFRTGCAMATALNTKKPVRLFVDDYKRRKQYHAIEEFLCTPQLIGRMAEFTVAPMTLPIGRLATIIEMMTRP